MKHFISIVLTAASFLTSLRAQSLQPTMTEALLTVNVTDMQENPREGEAITFESVKTKKQYSGVTGTNGKFYLLVPKGDSYKVMYKSFTGEEDYTTFDMPKAQDTLLSFEFQLKYDLPKTYTLDNVYFDTGKSTLRPESFKEIDELAEFLLLKKSMVIEIAGHTDNVGKPEANMKLSQDRADAVRNYLIKKGVKSENVTAKGYGDTQPVGKNDTDAGKQRNRRTEVRIIKEK